MTFTQELALKTEYAKAWIEFLAPKGEGYHKDIFDAANYSIKAGGKRIRPILAIAVCEMLGGKTELVMPFACAIEFIHTYSLIHDDLPCMDNDDLRRGMPTNHIKYGEAMALLAGDTLLNYAFETVANAKAEPKLIVEVLKLISSASGVNGMIGGQVIDIQGASSYDELIAMHKMKTGALISVSAKVGAVVACADSQKLAQITAYAENLGMAFQIRDDLLDVEGDEKSLGKPIGSDEKSGKCTFVNFLGIDGTKSALNEYTIKAKRSLDIFGDKAEFLLNLADYLLTREK